MTKAELDLLEKAFSAEIDGAINNRSRLLQTRSTKLAEKMVAAGYLRPSTERIPSSLGSITVKGYELTFLGNVTYCFSERCYPPEAA